MYFFAEISRTNLTTEEADEPSSFIRLGGVVYISGNAYSQGVGIPGHEGSNYNPLFSSLGIADNFLAGEKVDFYPCGTVSEPIETPVTNATFGKLALLVMNFLIQ